MMASSTPRYPPGLNGGLEHDDEDHRVGETGQKGPEGDSDIDRSHRKQGGRDDDRGTSREAPNAPKR